MLFKDNYLAAGCQGSPDPKSSEGRHFSVLLVATVAGDPGRWDTSPGHDHVLLAWVWRELEPHGQGINCCSIEVVTHGGGKTYLDNGKNLYFAGVESGIYPLHCD